VDDLESDYCLTTALLSADGEPTAAGQWSVEVDSLDAGLNEFCHFAYASIKVAS